MSYLQIMCLIMNCSTGRSTDTAIGAVQLWVDTYAAVGVKSNLSATERLWAKSQVLQLQYLAATDPGVLPTELNLAFTNSLTSILAELDP
ncbi:MAG: hypothetical protein AABZ53_13525 [Planctomycetota bacterium]